MPKIHDRTVAGTVRTLGFATPRQGGLARVRSKGGASLSPGLHRLAHQYRLTDLLPEVIREKCLECQAAATSDAAPVPEAPRSPFRQPMSPDGASTVHAPRKSM